MSTVVSSTTSERDQVIRYLSKRLVATFAAGEDEEAQDINQFLGRLEGMSDEEYTEVFG